ncbi:MAG: zinc-ribbon domain-containing protein [Rhodobacteraceae bacterium]|nr:zinc-ribbon domain-containing protein [Paracoccaceae bacterium]
MRLVCRKCTAQYEVDESAIPKQGREVQCTNCGHTWFQYPLALLPDRPEAPAPITFGISEGPARIANTGFRSIRAQPNLGKEDNAKNLPADSSDTTGPGRPPWPPAADGVREVLQSEAAFSSAPATPDAAPAAPSDGGGHANTNDPANRNRGGFRRAFVRIIFVVALVIALYILRPQIVAALPVAAAVLDPYARLIDDLRWWLFMACRDGFCGS